jgi:filamentous hemagglutinin family protein
MPFRFAIPKQVAHLFRDMVGNHVENGRWKMKDRESEVEHLVPHRLSTLVLRPSTLKSRTQVCLPGRCFATGTASLLARPLLRSRYGRSHPLPFGLRLTATALSALLFLTSSPVALAITMGEVRSGVVAGQSGGRGSAANLQNAGAASAAMTAALARQSLQRSDTALGAMRAMQQNAAAAARAAALNGNPILPNGQTINGSAVIPNGLAVNWLHPHDGFDGNGNPLTTSWKGASIDMAKTTPAGSSGDHNIEITQSEQNAYLYWKDFNVGPRTTINFDQSKGGADAGKWIAFNKITGNDSPSSIYGKINAQGQVYILNQNGIMFHNGSEVNVHALVASTLPINPYLAGDPMNGIEGRGLLNNPGAQFLFSALPLSQSINSFDDAPKSGSPQVALKSSEVGAVYVAKGASISTAASETPGRVMLAGPSVINEGSIATPEGQTILAAGLQVGMASHPSIDPSLRGLDVYVGRVADLEGNSSGKSYVDDSGVSRSYLAGTVINNGLIETSRGAASFAGRFLTQNGVVESSTSVSLNGRVDFLASYNAVVSPLGSAGNFQPYFYDPLQIGGSTGEIVFGRGSSTRILPEWSNHEKTIGTGLSLPSVASVIGNSILFDQGSVLLAPGASSSPDSSKPFYDMTTLARPFGTDTGKDSASSVTAVLSSGISVSAGNFVRPKAGSGFLNSSSFLLGSFGDSVSAGSITVRPQALIDASGTTGTQVSVAENYATIQLRGPELANSPLQRENKAIRGKNITVDLRVTGTIDGQYWVGTPLGDATGYAGLVQRTVSQLTRDGGSVSLKAGNEVSLDPQSGVNVSGGWIQYTGDYVSTSKLYYLGSQIDISQATPDRIYGGIVKDIPKTYENGYYEGGSGGSLTIQGSEVSLLGNLFGTVVNGARQLRSTQTSSSLAKPAGLTMTLKTEVLDGGQRFNGSAQRNAVVIGDSGGDSLSTVINPAWFGGNGFGTLSVNNHDGSVLLPSGTLLALGPGGTLSLDASVITIGGGVSAPGGSIMAVVRNFNSHEVEVVIPGEEDSRLSGNPGRGVLSLLGGGFLDVSGLLAIDLPGSSMETPLILDGGRIDLSGYRLDLQKGSKLAADAGAQILPRITSYGKGGDLIFKGGRDTEIQTAHDGSVVLDSAMTALGGRGKRGGSLELAAPSFLIGSYSSLPDVLSLPTGFFSAGGFSDFILEGTGIESARGGGTEIEGIRVSGGALIRPVTTFFEYNQAGRRSLGTFPLPFQQPVSLSMKTEALYNEKKKGNSGSLVTSGLLVVDEGATFILDAGASLVSKADVVPLTTTGRLDLSGSVVKFDGRAYVPGGDVTISGAGDYPVAQPALESTARATVMIGSGAKISTAGILIEVQDPLGLGRRLGAVLDGGRISLTGNLQLEQGSRLNVSGASGGLYVPSISGKMPSSLGSETRVDSSGGSIKLAGSHMMVSSASLSGRSGGDGGRGGSLSVSSGRFYNPVRDEVYDPRNFTLELFQGIRSMVDAVVSDRAAGVSSRGYFAADSLVGSGLETLGLAGNIRFHEDTSIDLPGGIVRLADGGVLGCAAGVASRTTLSVSAGYISLGKPFAGPLTENDPEKKLMFGFGPAYGYDGPTTGNGRLALMAADADIGTLLLKGVGQAEITASKGMIRGDGTVDIAGQLTLTAPVVTPVTDGVFRIFAFDAPGTQGKVSLRRTGSWQLPLEAAGSISVYASVIEQAGVISAPLGVITLGWNGAEGNSPRDPLSGAGGLKTGVSAPVTTSLSLSPGSISSTAAIDPKSGRDVSVPYGVILNQTEWIDPRGITISASGPDTKSVTLSSDSLSMSPDATIDARGGGDLMAYHWESGLQGTIDPTSQPSGGYAAGTSYSVGDKVTYQGRVYSARRGGTLGIPAIGTEWTEVKEGFAILPSYEASLAPFLRFFSTSATGGDPGYVSSLSPGDRISLAGGAGLAPGEYTLLPSRYAILPGAYLVNPTGDVQGTLPSVVEKLDGSVLSSGYRLSAFGSTSQEAAIRHMYAVSSPRVLAQKAQYTMESASGFFAHSTPNLPSDAASVSLLGRSSLALRGVVLGSSGSGGSGSLISISSSSRFIVGRGEAPAGSLSIDPSVIGGWSFGTLMLGASIDPASPGESRAMRVASESVEFSPGANLYGSEIIVAATKSILMGAGSSLVSLGTSVSPVGTLSVTGDGVLLRVSGDPASDVVRSLFSENSPARISVAEGVTLGGDSILIDSSGGASFAGSVSFAGSSPQSSPALSLKSGSIAMKLSSSDKIDSDVMLYAPSSLVLAGETLVGLQSARSLSLTSYSTIDFFGGGSFGNASLALKLHAGGLRGFDLAGGTVELLAGSILMDNAFSGKPASPVTSVSDGYLELVAPVISLGDNTVNIDQFSYVQLAASGSVRGTGQGGLCVGTSSWSYRTTSGDEGLTLAELAAGDSLSCRGFNAVAVAKANGLDPDAPLSRDMNLLIPQSAQQLFVTTPRITGMAGSSLSLKASGAVNLDAPDPEYVTPTDLVAGLGASLSLEGDAVGINTRTVLPSGFFSAIARGGDVVVGVSGNALIDVSGRKAWFHDAVKFTDAGTISLSSDSGCVVLGASSNFNLSADQGGGSAGTLSVGAPIGGFAMDSLAKLDGSAGAFGKKGIFILDASVLGSPEAGVSSMASIAPILANGAFTESLSLRIRSGDVEVDSLVKAHSFALTADHGSITVTPDGVIDASGKTGGNIALQASGSVILMPNSALTVRGDTYDNAGKGGSVFLSAGAAVERKAEDGTTYLDINRDAVLDLRTASSIDLGVTAVPRSFGTDPTSGKTMTDQFGGTLQLRAPITVDLSDIQIGSTDATISGASSIAVEGFKVYDLTGSSGEITAGLRSTIAADAAAFFGASGGNSVVAHTVLSRLMQNQDQSFIGTINLASGVEIVNRSGGLSLNDDWDFSTLRYGANAAPGFLTLRAAGDITLNASLSDGFRSAAYDAGLMDFNQHLNANFQSWSYTISAGGDLSSVDPSRMGVNGCLKIGKPSLNSNAYDGSKDGPNDPSRGQGALLSDLVSGNHQVIRTGSGGINVSAATDIQFLNQFAAIYTAGTRDRNPTLGGTFDLHEPAPMQDDLNSSPNVLGRVQQEYPYPSQFSLSGGNVSLVAGRNIAHLQLKTKGYQDAYEGDSLLTIDSSRQLPNNWISRRGGVDKSGQWILSPTDAGGTEAYSTSWWINFANYFEGVATLGGGNITLIAGGDVSNVDASIATQGRLTARDPLGNRLAPAFGTLVETGGGDLAVRAKGDINAGVYYVERGQGVVFAGKSIVSNYTRDASGGYLSSLQYTGFESTAVLSKSHPEGWLPTSFLLGNASMSVTAGRGMLLGPVGNAFLLPQGVDAGIRNKNYFSTYGDLSSFSALSLGGDITLRTTLSDSIGAASELPAFQAWFASSALGESSYSPGSLMPWIRLAESKPRDINLGVAMALMPSTMSLTALSGGVLLAGNMTLAPSPRGGLEVLALKGIDGMHSVVSKALWASSAINVSDAPLGSIPGVLAPLSQSAGSPELETSTDYLNGLTAALSETASFTGENALIDRKIARHDSRLLHAGDPNPVRIDSLSGMVCNLGLFSPKRAEIRAGGDIANVQLVIQNVFHDDVSVVSSVSGMVLYDANTASRLAALNDVGGRPYLVSEPFAGDIQISGPGTLIVQSGGSIDLGTGSQNKDGTGAGITSIGNARNPFLPFSGADIIVDAGLSPLAGANVRGLISYAAEAVASSRYFGDMVALIRLGSNASLADKLNDEGSFSAILDGALTDSELEITAQALALSILRDCGRDFNDSKSPGYRTYSAGRKALDRYYGGSSGSGSLKAWSRNIRTRSGGNVLIAAPHGGVTLARTQVGESLAPPGIITEYGGAIGIFTRDSVDIGIGRIFTLRGGDIMIWSDKGNIAAGSSAKTVATAPPTRAILDPQSADVQTDLAGLATGGGIGVLASVKGIPPANVDLIAPTGYIDAGDAGIRSTGNLNLAAEKILNADNILVGGVAVGAPPAAPPAAAPVAAPPAAAPPAGANSAAAANNNTADTASRNNAAAGQGDQAPSIFSIDILGYGGGDGGEDDENKAASLQSGPAQAAL